MSTKNTCRAKNPATCRTHGEPIRKNIARMQQIFGNQMPELYSRSQVLTKLNRYDTYTPEATKMADEILDKVFAKRLTVESYAISGAFFDKQTEITGQMNKGKVNWSTYPGDSLKHRAGTAGGSKGWYDRKMWLHENGVSDEAPDTAFGSQYVYCASHLNAHLAGWCTVSIVDKAPLKAKDMQSAVAEARGNEFPIYGDPKPEPAAAPPEKYGVPTGRALDNQKWMGKLPADQRSEVNNRVRRGKKKDALLIVDNYRKEIEGVEAK
jgi:hypothetical protein